MTTSHGSQYGDDVPWQTGKMAYDEDEAAQAVAQLGA